MATPWPEQSLPRPVSVVESQLREFRAACKSANKYGAPDFASQIALDSMQNHEEELMEELKAAQLLESDADAEFSVSGEPVRGNLIPIALLGKFFEHLQKLMYSVAQSRQGIVSTRGTRRGDIVRENQLLVPPSFAPGSFRFRVRLLSKEELGLTEEPESKENLRILSSILDEQKSESDIVDVVSNPRVQSDYARILDLLAKENADLRIRSRETPFAKRFSASCARDRTRWLERLPTRQEESFLEGSLVGGSIESGRFELRGEEPELFRGILTDSAKNDIRKFHWDDRVRIHVRSRIEANEDGSFERIHHTALRIESAVQPDMFP